METLGPAPSGTDAVDLSVRQFREAWRLMCAGSPGFTLDEGGGVDYVFSGIPIAFFNVALVTGHDLSGESLQAHGRAACARASGEGVPWLFFVTHEGLRDDVDAVSVLGGCGLAQVLPMTGMLANRVAPPVRVPGSLRLSVPHDDTGCSAMIDVNSAAYGMDLHAAKSAIGTRRFWQSHVPVLGVVGDSPAASAAVMMVDGFRYVALVATHPDHQRRGYADAAMRHALAVAAETHGERPTFLHATDAGRPVYARMGYAPVSTHTAFMEKRFLEAH
ncbi:MAG TPA: GNAT family N-acetyltransferase [Vicinamibacterales bacterium]|nr:GNAT family N-acetyltransferase [Vicinamibacterales bacterium]